jgi:tripartite-type tricarboxylate transporter receptor subunit TctC
MTAASQRGLRRLAIAFCALALACGAQAQAWPAKPVRAVLPYSAGSGPDAVVRQVGEKLGKAWGQQLVVDNKPGANGWLAVGEVKRAPADGYTVLAVDNTHMTLQPHLYKQLPFAPTKDFEPVAPLYSTYFFIVVPADSPWKSVSDLVAAAKARKGELTYGTWGMGSVAHVGTAMLEAATDTQMTHVPFKELPQLYTAVATGEVAWAFGTAATVGPLFKAKKVRLLAIAAPRRLAGYADVPTVAEAGGPAGFELKTWVALFAPKGTPRPVLDQLNAGVARALADPEVRERLAGFGFEPWTGSGAQLAAAAETDTGRFAQVLKQARIQLD